MMRASTKPVQRSAGFSLVELMIAMVLGLFLIAGMIAVFAGNKRSSELNTAMANIQENARFALNAMARDARMSSYQGCLDVNSGALEIRANAAPTANIRDTATTGSVVVTSNTWVPAPPIGFAEPTATPAIPATHVLSLQFAGSTRGVLNDQLNDGISPTPAGDIVLDSNEPDPGLQNNDLAIISNCDFGDLFRVSNVGTNSGNIVIEHGAAVNSSGALTRAYGAPATIDQTIVAKFHSNIYFVADTGLTNNDGDP
ncbi:MAG: prepilin-type N-terminal cleavage/methylation domain-containing protein, partial [Gammaproteobacteria bacterium]|nr:prepilin-type N-terminal cleavage/methylation domain-containing protein [Gammaproteobacteria bacterium]